MTPEWDAVVIGSGFGGSMVALRLAEAGARVLVLERGRWVDRDATAWDTDAILLSRKYKSGTPFFDHQHRRPVPLYPDEAVGGKSVFYGAASFRLRVGDFVLGSSLHGADPPFVDWPIGYGDLAPFYDEAETLLGVAGIAGLDPNEPPRNGDFPQRPPPYGSPARRIAEAAAGLGLHPFPMPLAINFGADPDRPRCIQCLTCDLFPCRICAKNDLAVAVLPKAVARGAAVRPSTIAERLLRQGNEIRGVEYLDRATGARGVVNADVYVVSCGAVASAALLLRSGLQHVGPNGPLIGRHLMRHCSGIVIGIYRFKTNPEGRFHKQVAITDFYFGHPDRRAPEGPWGMIQGLQVPPPEFIAAYGRFPGNFLGALTVARHIYLMCIAHDRPSPANRVEADASRTDGDGLPVTRVFHRYTLKDLRARRALYGEAARIIRQSGALIRVRKPVDTYSHAVGTCRFGDDPHTAVLDPWCRFFGLRNLFVVDGSFMPTAGGVNPSLTIAANALRVARCVVEAL
ncbi:MAG: GMC family oxidoreductase [Gemmatimonadales bacterium]